MKRFLLFSGLVMAMFSCSQPKEETIQTFQSSIEYYPKFQSQRIAQRNVEVFLPRQYFEEPEQKFDVLYMHDGQNVFNASTAYGGVAWEVDSILQELLDNEQVRPTIVVAVWNTEKRYLEYCPEGVFLSMDSLVQDSIRAAYKLNDELLADEYLQFLTSELKPFIDSTYRVNQSPAHTFVMGSSMGGLISCYALLEYPEIFGGAACVSTHWPLSHAAGYHPFAAQMVKYVQHEIHLLSDQQKLYFDYGTETLDSLYEPYQLLIDSVILASDFNTDNYKSLKFEGAAHDEASWQNRLNIPLTFLLHK